jgi:uncharacterized OB-fold protein
VSASIFEGILLPDVDRVSAPFWEGTAAGELRVQACGACGRWRFPPRPMCPACRSLDVKWVATSGGGSIWSYVVPHPPLLPAYERMAPYNVVVVALDDDLSIRMVGNLVASADGPLDEVDPASIVIGEPVRVVFPEPVDGVVLPRWVRA